MAMKEIINFTMFLFWKVMIHQSSFLLVLGMKYQILVGRLLEF